VGEQGLFNGDVVLDGLRVEIPKFEFAHDSALEGDGFELPVPRKIGAISRPLLCHFVIAPIPPMEAPFRIQEPMGSNPPSAIKIAFYLFG
jgi:hypothetical protein